MSFLVAHLAPHSPVEWLILVLGVAFGLVLVVMSSRWASDEDEPADEQE